MNAPEIELAADERLAFDHLVAYGIATVAAGYHDARARIWWTDDEPTRLRLSGFSWGQIADAVKRHATAAASEDGWIYANGTNRGAPAGLFSPRVKQMQQDELVAWYRQRSGVLATLRSDPPDRLSLALIGSLGEPSYWSDTGDGPRPDNGASRWEMKTRNRGEEFVTHRLRPLAAAVAARTTEQILQGLTGTKLRDEVGKGKPESRTPTGLVAPRPTDNARAWCALWGLGLMPVVHQVGAASATAGHVGSLGSGYFYLPLVTRPTSIARLASITRSAALRVVAAQSAVDQDENAVRDAWRWLNARGVGDVIVFPVHRTANANAPERWATRGRSAKR